MYTLNQEQVASIEAFIGKMQDSMVKSHYEKWLEEVKPTMRVTAEQSEKFVSFANSLPKALQNYPQSLTDWLKNGDTTARRESKEDIKQSAELGSIVNESIASVPNVSAPKNKETTLHKLGKEEKQKGKKSTEEDEKEESQKQPVREGAKLHSDKEHETKAVKPTTVVIQKGKH